MIKVQVSSKSFGPDEILRDITFKMKRGERLALLGPSGIGKSTLLRIISGLDTQFEGQIDVPQKLAFVFQEPTLLPWRTVAANLTLTTGARDPEAALSAVGLAGFGTYFPGQLSLGQQRRVALARALSASPELLILDEPYASLDRETADDMMALTRSLADQLACALLVVTHAPEEAAGLASRAIVLAGKPASIAEIRSL